ncbi:AraC family transcriptional regulator [Chryseobacterium fluminis]|uniref:helix-turn-helix domain-containing protein n=1 Tax=Chryseobacterium fluminis TaxID=2983606 RepID=UPI0022523EFF|nr:AraC family transcriptional regulator [Chryseobacterium sp. MMS21-Ot14]UZT99039.1 AraC family transcriptional regulator [Chryseobacterium sp. MMS21-Ot14]
MIKTLTYTSNKQAPRNKIFLPHHLISFLEQGEKVVYYANEATTIIDDQLVILSSGNCIMTEKIPVKNSYVSTMLLFDNTAFSNFLVKYASLLDKIPKSQTVKEKKPFVVFEKDDFIRNYITSLKLVQTKPDSFSDKLLELKFEELMLHLLEKYPHEILCFNTEMKENYADFEIRKTVELNISNNLTVEELSFLCHMSVSTFNRKFIKLYSETPSKYLLQQKMKLAKFLLQQNENPSEVFFKVGYENHSSFSKSFKQAFGICPKEFQHQKLTESRQHLTDQP